MVMIYLFTLPYDGRSEIEISYVRCVYWCKVVYHSLILPLSYFTFQEPPLSGPSLSIIPSAFSFARCFSIAFAVTPISAARPAAVNLPFSERRAMIFSLLLPVFLLPFEVFSLLSSLSEMAISSYKLKTKHHLTPNKHGQPCLFKKKHPDNCISIKYTNKIRNEQTNS